MELKKNQQEMLTGMGRFGGRLAKTRHLRNAFRSYCERKSIELQRLAGSCQNTQVAFERKINVSEWEYQKENVSYSHFPPAKYSASQVPKWWGG